MTSLILAFISLSITPESVADIGSARPSVGAIRWDGWNQWGYYEKCFDPLEWRSRLPFYATVSPEGKARVRGDSREVIDQEIQYAAKAGLDYWAFVWYHPDGWPPHSADMGRCLELYRSSALRDNLKYCLIVPGDANLGPKDRLDETLDILAAMLAEPNYFKTPDGRPLLYLFDPASIITWTGSENAAKTFVDGLRKRALKAELSNPYIVVMEFNAVTGARMAMNLGGDAIGSYSGFGGTTNSEHPYADLVQQNRSFWEQCKGTGAATVPIVNSGWDYRPMKRQEYPDRDLKADWFTTPSPDEFADHLRGSLDWTRANPATCPARTVLVYAWNELSEGGWLTPTLQEGTARLDAVSKALAPSSTPQVITNYGK